MKKWAIIWIHLAEPWFNISDRFIFTENFTLKDIGSNFVSIYEEFTEYKSLISSIICTKTTQENLHNHVYASHTLVLLTISNCCSGTKKQCTMFFLVYCPHVIYLCQNLFSIHSISFHALLEVSHRLRDKTNS